MPRPPSAVSVDPVALKILREKDGHTKTSLARAAGLSISYIHDLESGHRRGCNPEVITKLAKALNVPRSMLEKAREEAA